MKMFKLKKSKVYILSSNIINKKDRPNKVNYLIGSQSRYDSFYSHKETKTPTHHNVVHIYGVKEWCNYL